MLSVSHLNRLKYAVSLELPSLLYCSIIDESKKMFGEDVFLEHEHPEVENMYVWQLRRHYVPQVGTHSRQAEVQ